MRGTLVFSLAAILLGPASARADIFVLANQGEVRGDLVNKTEVPRRTYVIQLSGGGEITLDKEQVTEVRRETPAQLEYERRRATAKDIVADHWTLAEYCRQNVMLASREHHLKRILELEPDHESARRGLGYTRVAGGWKTQEQIMTERGYVRYKGDWKLPQEVELEEARRKAELVEIEWQGNLKRWRGWLRSDRAEKALEQIRQIEDPNAVKAIQGQLKDEKDPKLRRLWLQTLGQIDSSFARSVLVDVSLADRDLELRLIAVEQLGKARSKDPGVVKQYVKALKSTENPIINRAADRPGGYGRQVGHRPADRRAGNLAQENHYPGLAADPFHVRHRRQLRSRRPLCRQQHQDDPREAEQPGRAQRAGEAGRGELQLRGRPLEGLARRPAPGRGRQREAGLVLGYWLLVISVWL